MRKVRAAGVGAFVGDFDAFGAVEPPETDNSRRSRPPPEMGPKMRNATFNSYLAANFDSKSSHPMAFCHESSPQQAFGVEGFPELAILPPDGV